MGYVEGFVLAEPSNKKDAYRNHAAAAEPMFKEFGATRLVEAWGDDIPDGKLNDLKGAVKANSDETVVFSWLEYPDKDTRDQAAERMRADPRMEEMGAAMPFDGKRMIYGGFALVHDKGPRAEGDSSATGYVDGMLASVPAGEGQAYRQFADHTSALFREYGALRVAHGWGEDVPDGKVTDFKRAVLAQPGEQILFTWIEWPSKDIRDQAWQKSMTDPRMHAHQPPFDGKRMIFGGFAPIVDK
jgi:uncharacterized protein YbaA (DUF1428 family)